MCRNIKALFNFDPPATDEEIEASAMQFVRKVSGFRKPSKANAEVFQQAVEEISGVTQKLLHSLVTDLPAKNREAEAAKARARATRRS